MGLDVVEILIRVEEEFSIKIPDDSSGRTVGDLYRLILEKLNLPYESARNIEGNPPAGISKYSPWSTPSVWIHLKRLIADQLQVNSDEIREDSSFSDDLGAD